jgi:hypothetical protein
MKNLLSFNEYINESVLNEANFLDVWPKLPYGDWKSEYEIPAKIQKELYLELQDKLGSKSLKVKEDIEDPAKSPIFNELATMAEYDAFWSWTSRSESTSIGAFELKNGEIVIAVFQTYSWGDPKETQLWTIQK